MSQETSKRNALHVYTVSQAYEALFVPQNFSVVYDEVRWMGPDETELNAANTGISGQPTISLRTNKVYAKQDNGKIDLADQALRTEFEQKIQDAVEGVSTRNLAYADTVNTLTVSAADALVNAIDPQYRTEGVKIVMKMADGTKFDDGKANPDSLHDFKYGGEINIVIGSGGAITYAPSPDSVDNQLNATDENRVAQLEQESGNLRTELDAEKAKVIQLQSFRNAYEAFDNVQRLLSAKYQASDVEYTNGLDVQQNGQNIEIASTDLPSSGNIAVMVETSADKPFLAEGSISAGKLVVDNSAGNYNYIIGLVPTKIIKLEASNDVFDKTLYDTITAAQTKRAANLQAAKDYANSLAGNYDVSGAAAQAETNAKQYADGLKNQSDLAIQAEQNSRNSFEAFQKIQDSLLARNYINVSSGTVGVGSKTVMAGTGADAGKFLLNIQSSSQPEDGNVVLRVTLVSANGGHSYLISGTSANGIVTLTDTGYEWLAGQSVSNFRIMRLSSVAISEAESNAISHTDVEVAKKVDLASEIKQDISSEMNFAKKVVFGGTQYTTIAGGGSYGVNNGGGQTNVINVFSANELIGGLILNQTYKLSVDGVVYDATLTAKNTGTGAGTFSTTQATSGLSSTSPSPAVVAVVEEQAPDANASVEVKVPFFASTEYMTEGGQHKFYLDTEKARINGELDNREIKNIPNDYPVVEGQGQGINYPTVGATVQKRPVYISTSKQFDTINVKLLKDNGNTLVQEGVSFSKWLTDDGNGNMTVYSGIVIDEFVKDIDLAAGGAIFRVTGKA